MLLTTKQAQEHYHLSRPTLYKRAKEGEIPAIKIGNIWRFEVKEEDYKK